MMSLWKFDVNYFRHGHIFGLFIAEESKVLQAIHSGQTVYFGEILGKYSEITYDFRDHDFVKILLSQETLQELCDAFQSTDLVGINPLNYIGEEEEGEEI